MSAPAIQAVGPVIGLCNAASILITTDGTQTGAADVSVASFTGTALDAVGYAQLVPSNILAMAYSGWNNALVELDDTGLAFLQVNVVDFNPASIGRFEEGDDPQRKYGSIGFWAGDNFLGWRAISRLRNRYNLYSSDFGNSQILAPLFGVVFNYVFATGYLLENYRNLIFSFMNSFGLANITRISRITWSLAPSVRVSLVGSNACHGVVSVYAN